MLVLVTRVLFVFLLWLGGAVNASAWCEFPSYPILDSVVRVLGESAEGSGVIVAENLVITAAHVIEGEPILNVEVRGVAQYAELISMMPGSDLALLRVNTRGQAPLPINPIVLEPTDTVWAVGFPLGGSQLASQGVYQGVARHSGKLKTTASVNHGQSGGGLLACINGRYVLAGVLSAFGAINVGGQFVRLEDYSVSVPAKDITALLSANTIR